MDDYGAIRRAHRDGVSIKQIARQFRHSWNTTRKVHRLPHAGPIPAARLRTAPVLGLVGEAIEPTNPSSKIRRRGQEFDDWRNDQMQSNAWAGREIRLVSL